MLLSLDIGNTTTTIGLFDEDKLVDTWSIASEKHRSEDELGVLLINLLTFHNYAETYEELHRYLDGSIEKILAGENAECVQNFKNFFASSIFSDADGMTAL